LRDIVSDFYDSEELGRAKTQLFDDIQSVISSSRSMPHIPTRRDGDNKAMHITDDILTMITFADQYSPGPYARGRGWGYEDPPNIQKYTKNVLRIGQVHAQQHLKNLTVKTFQMWQC